MLEEQPRPLAARDRELEFQWFRKGNREPLRIGGARGATETPRSRSGGAGESESVTARPGESQEAEGKPRWSPAKPGEPIRSEMATGDAWWSEKGTGEAWRRQTPRENKKTLNF